jgi:hypothetical protein
VECLALTAAGGVELGQLVNRFNEMAEGLAVSKQASAPCYRAALMLHIAPSVGRTTTERPESIWATMVSGVLARKSKKERLEPLFFMLDTFHVRQSAGVD